MLNHQRASFIPAIFVLFFGLLMPQTSAGGQRQAAGVAPIQLSAARLPDGTPAPVLDGKILEEAWLRVAPYATFIQTDPIEGAPASAPKFGCCSTGRICISV